MPLSPTKTTIYYIFFSIAFLGLLYVVIARARESREPVIIHPLVLREMPTTVLASTSSAIATSTKEGVQGSTTGTSTLKAGVNGISSTSTATTSTKKKAVVNN